MTYLNFLLTFSKLQIWHWSLFNWYKRLTYQSNTSKPVSILKTRVTIVSILKLSWCIVRFFTIINHLQTLYSLVVDKFSKFLIKNIKSSSDSIVKIAQFPLPFTSLNVWFQLFSWITCQLAIIYSYGSIFIKHVTGLHQQSWAIEVCSFTM